MSSIKRRALVRYAIVGLAAVAAGTALSAGEALAAPFPIEPASKLALDNPVEQARTTCWWQGGRRVCHRRPVRRVCWWSHGRQVCTWR